MAATYQIFFHLFLATVLVNTLLESAASEDHSEHDDENSRHPQGEAVNGEVDERKWHWPGSVSFEIHREAKLDGLVDQPNQGNDTVDGERKFHWPSSASITIHRVGQVDSEAERPNAPVNDTDSERKFHWPSSVGITINRSGPALHHGNPQLPEGYKLDKEEKLFGFLPVLVSCDYTSQAGRTCVDCTHSLLCFPNNLGVQRDCGSRYCNDGRCSTQPHPNCTASSNE